MKIENIAHVCHAANTVFCRSLGDLSQPIWSQAPKWQVDSAINGVLFNLENKEAPASACHDSWMTEKKASGWKFGPVKNAEKKEHPCMVPFDELPAEQQAKDVLFSSIVNALAPLLNDDECSLVEAA